MGNPVFIAFKNAAGDIGRMQFETTKQPYEIDAHVALLHGFVLVDGVWTREATQALVDRELGRAMDGNEFGPAVSWRIVRAQDFPPSEAGVRKKWTDNGVKIREK